ncbi:MAG TPA: hypothetical protein EYP28_05350 [Methanophagales archaeon]|nr:hypothetical protein [Methanophagales archaeon]
MKHIKVAPGLVLLCVFLASVPIAGSSVTELNVPSFVVQGETLSISGKALPNEVVWLDSSFELSLPVSDGRYSEEFWGINFIEGEKKISARAENIKNMQMSVSPFTATCNGATVKVTTTILGVAVPVIEAPLKITNGIVTLSFSFPMEISGFEIDIPPGKRDIKISGDAMDDATSVNLEIATSIKVTANSNGDFLLDIDTEGVPLGEFLITAGEIEKTVQIVLTEPASTSIQRSPAITPASTPVITPTISPILTSSSSPKPSSTPKPSATSTPTEKPSPSPTPTLTEKPSPSPTPAPRLIPGFEALFAIAGLLAVAYFVLTLRRK